MEKQKYAAIVLAAGSGKRMNSQVHKQYLIIQDRPVLYYSLKAFEDSAVDEIVLVVGKGEEEFCRKEIVDKYGISKVKAIVEGGKERYHSVFEGLKQTSDADYVLIHDGARPFVSEKIILDGIENAKKYGAAAPGVMPKDTIKVKDDFSFSKETLKRESLIAIQTPQVFKKDIIVKCHERVRENNVSVTDDTMVVEKYGYKVYLYDGDYINIKVTTPEDLILCEYLV